LRFLEQRSIVHLVNRRELIRAGAGALGFAACRAGAARTSSPPWEALGQSLEGRLLTPTDPEYPAAAQTLLARLDQPAPAAVVQCHSETDVVEALRFARAQGVHVAVRSGGHSFGGYSTTSGMMIDLRGLAAIRIESERIEVGGGALLGDVEAALAPHRLGLPLGTCPTVGLAGLTLGGGLGMTGRGYGFTADQLTSATVALADGRVVECDSRREPELFWALRGGGGGNFGIVTQLSLALHPVDQVTIFVLEWATNHSVSALSAWQRWAPDAPDELTSNLSLTVSQAMPRVRVYGQFLGSRSGLEELLSQLVHQVGADPSSESLQPMGYHDGSRFWSSAPSTNQEYRLTKSQLFRENLPATGIETLVAAMVEETAPDAARGIELAALGGAYNRVPADRTALIHRNSRFDVKYTITMPRSGTRLVKQRARTWIESAASRMRPWASGHSYQNYIDPALSSWREAYYGSNYARLVAVKRRYDPERLFRFEQAVGS
jgi:FAD/FMN-containing dehydrogenase